MDLEALRKAAQARRTSNLSDGTVFDESGVSQKVKPTWKCEFCTRIFKLEKAFMKHSCDEKRKIDEIKTPIGQSAYMYYSAWMKMMGRSVPPIETFIHSSLYNAFIKFSRHVHHVNMPFPEKFIRLMVQESVQPVLWCRDNVYAMYMQAFDKAMSPQDQFMESVEFLLGYSSRMEIEVGESFNRMGVEQFLMNVQKRKLSPWFLAASSVFKAWIKTLDSLESSQVEASVKVGSLMIRISSDPEQMNVFAEFCRTCREFNL